MSSHRSIAHREGFGDNLRLQLEKLGITQAQLAEAARISRSTISKAINEDRVSPATEEKVRVCLAQFAETRTPSDPQRKRAARSGGGAARNPAWAALCTVADLEAWAESRGAQAEFPRLVRRLILETGSQVTRLSMRAGDSIGFGGWDGLTESGGDNPWIPSGKAAWEMGVSRHPAKKAREDFTKRTASPGQVEPSETTFVFVTPRRWDGKETLGLDADNPWKEVRVIDGDDLEAWLGVAPSTHVWISRTIGTLPESVTDLGGFWDDWSLATSPPVAQGLLSAGREEALSELRERIQAGASPLTITAESRDEAIALLYCAANRLESEALESFLSRCIVLNAEAPLRALSGHPEPLVLIVRASVPAEVLAAASRAGHLVIVPRDPGEGDEVGAVKFPAVDRTRAAALLQEAGVREEEARRLASLARRSMSAFRRQRFVGGALAPPGWARPDVARTVLPALLLGEWTERHDGDREALASLARASYEDTIDSLTQWSEGQDPVLRQRGGHWYLVSREDSWQVLARFLRDADLERLSSLAMECFSEVDPSLAIPPENRWMAGILTDRPRFSNRVRRGLAGTLALLGARGELDPGPTSHAAFAAHAVREILEGAGNDWTRWASLAPVLPRLAEAAPDVFLEIVEEGTTGQDAVLRSIFSDGRPHGLFGASSPHTHLLWALERLAWSPAHFSRACAVLAALDRIDPGSPIRPGRDREGRLLNRPISSLTSLFRPWLPQTLAPLESRLEALDYLFEFDEKAAWAVALSMLPEHHGTAGRNNVPEFREWPVEPFRRLESQEVAGAHRGAVARLLKWVGSDGTRWTELIRATDRLPREYMQNVLDRLDTLESECSEEDTREFIWEALRNLVGRQRKFRKASWALPSGIVDEVDGLRLRFEPADALPQAVWLFGHDPYRPDASGWDESSFEAQREALEDARAEAVRRVISTAGKDGLVKLVSEVKDPYALGVTTGQLQEATPLIPELISRFLSAESSEHAGFAFGLASGRVKEAGANWIQSAIEGGIPGLRAEQKGLLLLVMPSSPETWSLADSIGGGAAENYWRLLQIYAIRAEFVEEATARLLRVRRPFAAVELLAMHLQRKREIPTHLIVQVLTAAIEMKNPVDQPQQSFSYSLGLLLDELELSGADTQVIARLEWATLPALRTFERRPRVLHRFLAENPEFFVELVRLAFRAEGEEPTELDEQDRNRAQLAYQLLEAWRGSPGTNDEGRIDGEALSAWLERARTLLAEEGRLAPGDRIIGQMFSRTPSDPDGSFPPAPIRRAIERLASPRIDEGLYMGIVNGRGVTTRLPHDGGKQERALAEEYEGLATAIASRSPRSARVLRRVAQSYRQDAAREDMAADLDEDMES